MAWFPCNPSGLPRLLFASCLLFALAVTAEDKATFVNGHKCRSDRIIVRPKKDKEGPLAALRAAKNVTLKKRFARFQDQQVLDLPAGADLKALLAAFQESGLVEYAQPSYVYQASVLPNDPMLASGAMWAPARIAAPAAWDIRSDAPNVIVGVIDSGVMYTHEDLAANMWINAAEANGTAGVDDDGNGFVDDVHGINAITGSGNPDDDHGHGSHVSGTIGAVGNNGKGVVGVAWNVQIMGLKFLSSEGSGDTADAITCMDYAIAKGAQILNNSWGGGPYDQALFDAIAGARDAGIVFVAAAGNDAYHNDRSPQYPASYAVDNVVSVASTTMEEKLSDFSNFGIQSVDLGAPGSDIASTYRFGAYATLSGTSMATPQVSGAFALLRAQFPADSPQQLINRLLKSVDKVPALDGQCRTGGRLNLHNALTTADARPPNDDFEDATPLSGDFFFAEGLSAAATQQGGEPNHAGQAGATATVWWTWTAPLSGSVSIDTVGSAFDTVLAVYTGSSVGSLTGVASDDDAGGGGKSKVTFTAASGTLYRIAVAGKSGASGLVLLNAPPPAPPNDHFANAQTTNAIWPAAPETAYTFKATKQANEPNHGEPDQPEPGWQFATGGGKSVWWKWTAATAEPVSLRTVGSDYDTTLAVYTGSTLSGLNNTKVAENDDVVSGTVRHSIVSFTAAAGTTYRIAVDGWDGHAGVAKLRIYRRPPNDNFAQAAVFGPGQGTAAGHNLHATAESGEPLHGKPDGGGNPTAGQSVWWKWTAPTDGTITVSTKGSNFDTTLGVYTGAAVNSLTLIGENDDDGSQVHSKLQFTAVEGLDYFIAVDGFAPGIFGDVLLSISLPPEVVSAPSALPNPVILE